MASQNFTRLGLSVSGDEAPASSGAPGGPSLPAISGGQPGPGTPLGRYMLVDRIGEGGMAEIYAAVTTGEAVSWASCP